MTVALDDGEEAGAYHRGMAYPSHPPNPFNESTLDRLFDSAMAAVRDIDAVGPRTADERRALALRCKQLLLALAARISPGDHMPHQPEHRLDDAERMADAFAAWADRQALTARFLAASRAVDWARRKAGLDLPVRFALAYETDDALRQALAELQQRCIAHRDGH